MRSLVAQAVAELHLGRVEEAESALDQVVKSEPGNADAIANALVLSIISGNDTDKLKEYVFPKYHLHSALAGCTCASWLT